jgi:hypothetical protein
LLRQRAPAEQDDQRQSDRQDQVSSLVHLSSLQEIRSGRAIHGIRAPDRGRTRPTGGSAPAS